MQAVVSGVPVVAALAVLVVQTLKFQAADPACMMH